MQEASCRRHLEGASGGGITGEASWGHLGGIWRHLESIWRHLEASGRHLGDNWEASGRHLGGIWEASGVIWEASEASRATQRHPGGSQEARRQLGGKSYQNMCFSVESCATDHFE